VEIKLKPGDGVRFLGLSGLFGLLGLGGTELYGTGQALNYTALGVIEPVGSDFYCMCLECPDFSCNFAPVDPIVINE
jgi:hypothetical protein